MKKEKGFRQRFEQQVIAFSRLSDKCIELKAENKRLREALEKVLVIVNGLKCLGVGIFIE